MSLTSSPSKLETKTKSLVNSGSVKNGSSLPQSKFGLGSDHGDIIVMLIKYFRIVAMVYGVWLIG